MAALFPPWANTVYRAVLAAGLVGATVVVAAPMVLARTSYVTGEDQPIEQPIEFDHRHHARDDGIDCLYCHPGAERTAHAGIPTTETCMGCHGQVWNQSPLLEPVRRSYFSGEPIRWRRVYDLPDFVYFHHGVHVQAGVACARCHGDVANMPRVYRAAPLTMTWCLDCHRDPPGPAHPGRRVTAITTCSACHR